jgi:hypothetical protein
MHVAGSIGFIGQPLSTYPWCCLSGDESPLLPQCESHAVSRSALVST